MVFVDSAYVAARHFYKVIRASVKKAQRAAGEATRDCQEKWTPAGNPSRRSCEPSLADKVQRRNRIDRKPMIIGDLQRYSAPSHRSGISFLGESQGYGAVCAFPLSVQSGQPLLINVHPWVCCSRLKMQSWLFDLPTTQETVVMKYLTVARKFVRKFITRQEEGATLAEYGLLLALIAVVCLAAITTLGTKISTMFQTLATSI
jgi:pilus assembly protein Flp/PilA